MSLCAIDPFPSNAHLRVHFWECAHEEVVNGDGLRVDWLATRDPTNTVERVKSPYPCPACTNLGASQVCIATKVGPVIGTTETRPEFWLPEGLTAASLLDPSATSFMPISAPAGYAPGQPGASQVASSSSAINSGTSKQPAVASLAPFKQTVPPAQAPALPIAQGMGPTSTFRAPNLPGRSFQPAASHETGSGNPFVPRNVQQPPSNAPTAPAAMMGPGATQIPQLYPRPLPHKAGKPCPVQHADCHWHYGDWCHNPWQGCQAARKAIRVAWDAKSEWKDAPAGWNEQHRDCIRQDNPMVCQFHRHIESEKYGRNMGNQRFGRGFI